MSFRTTHHGSQITCLCAHSKTTHVHINHYLLLLQARSLIFDHLRPRKYTFSSRLRVATEGILDGDDLVRTLITRRNLMAHVVAGDGLRLEDLAGTFLVAFCYILTACVSEGEGGRATKVESNIGVAASMNVDTTFATLADFDAGIWVNCLCEFGTALAGAI